MDARKAREDLLALRTSVRELTTQNARLETENLELRQKLVRKDALIEILNDEVATYRKAKADNWIREATK